MNKLKSLLLLLAMAVLTVSGADSTPATTPTKGTTTETPTRTPTPTPTPTKVKPCVRTGCNNELCAKEASTSICTYKPEYKCYIFARCELQKSVDGAD